MSSLIFQKLSGCIWERLARLAHPSLKMAQPTAPAGIHSPVECRYTYTDKNTLFFFYPKQSRHLTASYSLRITTISGTGAWRSLWSCLVASSRQPQSFRYIFLHVPANIRALGTSFCKLPPALEPQVHLLASSRRRQRFRYILLQIPASLRASGTSCCKFPPASELQVHLVASSRQPCQPQSSWYILLQVPASLRFLLLHVPPTWELQVRLVPISCQPQSFRYIFLHAPSKLRASACILLQIPDTVLREKVFWIKISNKATQVLGVHNFLKFLVIHLNKKYIFIRDTGRTTARLYSDFSAKHTGMIINVAIAQYKCRRLINSTISTFSFLRGVKGFVKDENFAPIEGASMKVRGRDVGFQTTKVRF